MQGWFPALEPYASGLLAVGDGHQPYGECCGNPAGRRRPPRIESAPAASRYGRHTVQGR
jgi:hypothetical protein